MSSEVRGGHAGFCGGALRRCRDITGHQSYTYGLVAKQPNSQGNRLSAIQQKMTAESSKDNEHAMKQNQRDIINSKFHISTDKKSLEAKIRNKVNQELQAADDYLNSKRERLREMLLEEERQHTSEFVREAQQVTQHLYDEQKRKALECRVRKQAEESALAAEKRMLQYMNRCEELRTFRESLNKRDVAAAVLKQIEDKKKQREADFEMEQMWNDVAMKNYNLMAAYEEEEQRKRQIKMHEMNTILQNQIKGHKLYEDEEKKSKLDLQLQFEKEREQLLEEEKSAQQKQILKKQKMYEEMEEVKRLSKELHERRKAQEKVLDDMFCQLIQQELSNEKDRVQDNKSQLRKESDLFRAYLEETAVKRKKAESDADDLRAREVAKIQATEHELQVKKCEAALKLKEEVLKGRENQMKERQRQKEEDKKKLEEEARLAELLRLESLLVDKERQKALQIQHRQYRDDLAQQIEYNRQCLLKQCEDEERQLQESIIKEEAYFNQVKDMMTNQCSSQVHPFLKKFQGIAI